MKEIDNAPPVLYLKGSLLEDDEWSVAVVGTRRITSYGRQVANEITHTLASSGITVVSGLARGVDAIAHHAALNAGATFIVLPTLIKDVVGYCVEHNIPVFPGALTPQEISDAWQAGATMVKVFPAKAFGPSYFIEIKGPFQDIELLACGGINSNNIQNYFQCGASAVAFGGSIFSPERFQSKEFTSIKEDIEQLIASFKSIS